MISLLIQQLILLFFNTVRAKEQGLLPPRYTSYVSIYLSIYLSNYIYQPIYLDFFLSIYLYVYSFYVYPDIFPVLSSNVDNNYFLHSPIYYFRGIFSITMFTIFFLLFMVQIFFHSFKVRFIFVFLFLVK